MTHAVQQRFGFSIPQDDSVELVMGRLPAADLVTVPDIASALNISTSTVREWIEDGSLPSLPCGAGDKREFRKVSRNTFKRFLELRKDGLA